MSHHDEQDKVAIRWLVVIFIVALGILMVIVGIGMAGDARDAEARFDRATERLHLCATAADNGAAWQRCADQAVKAGRR